MVAKTSDSIEADSMASERKRRRRVAQKPGVALVTGGRLTIPEFSEEEVRYLDERRNVAFNVDLTEKIGGCNDRQTRIDGPRRH